MARSAPYGKEADTKSKALLQFSVVDWLVRIANELRAIAC